MTAGRARALLGLAPGAEGEAVAAAFRAAVKAAHPDRPGGDAERLRQVIEAHRLLQSLAEAKLQFAPVRRPAARPAPAAPRARSLWLQISVVEALFGGERRIEVEPGRKLDVRLPAGLRAGEALRLQGAGDGGGHVFLKISVTAEESLSARGHDVWLEAAADARQLAEGSRLEIDTPRGRRAFEVPPGAVTGTMVRLKGEGLPARGRHPAGDLILKLAVQEDTGESAAQRMLRRFSARWAA